MPQRSPESEVLLLCARQHVPQPCAERIAELCRGAGFNWNRLRRAALFHQIPSLVLMNLLRIETVAPRMPPVIAERWEHIRTRNILGKQRQVRTVRKIVEFFAGRSIRVMLIKGAALDAAVYDEPWYTQSADVDLIVDAACQDLSQDDARSLAAMVRGRRVELQFLRHHDVDMNGVVKIDFERVWADARLVSLGSTRAYIMSPEDMLLTTCVNLCRKGYMQLKGMMAVRELVEIYASLDWEKLARRAVACGASRIVYAALTVTSGVLVCDVPDHALESLRIGFVRAWVIRTLGRLISTNLFKIQQRDREAATRRLVSRLLQIASYHVAQLKSEVRAQVELRRFRAIHPVLASKTERTQGVQRRSGRSVSAS